MVGGGVWCVVLVLVCALQFIVHSINLMFYFSDVSKFWCSVITVYPGTCTSTQRCSWHKCEFNLISDILCSDWRHFNCSIIWQLSWQAHIVCTPRSLPEHEPLFDSSRAATKDMITPAVFPAPTTRSSAIWPLSKLNVRLAQCLSKTLCLCQLGALDTTICSRCCDIPVAPDCISSAKKWMPCSPQTYCTIDSFKI